MRPPYETIFMQLAKNLSQRSLDPRLKVGCVITDEHYERVLGLGFNGGARGQSDLPESDIPGASQLIHAEVNALIKCDNTVQNKVVFLTHAPCKICAKMLVNARVKEVYYNEIYRDVTGLEILKNANVKVTKYETKIF